MSETAKETWYESLEEVKADLDRCMGRAGEVVEYGLGPEPRNAVAYPPGDGSEGNTLLFICENRPAAGESPLRRGMVRVCDII